jgi:hypothetical protein
MSVDAVRELLRGRGCHETVVDAGLEGLVSEWEAVVASIENGYGLGLDDYLHDVDGRELIAAVAAGVPAALTPALRRRLAAADARARAALVPHVHCLWGQRLALANGWTREEHWWYFMRPRTPGPELARELGLP